VYLVSSLHEAEERPPPAANAMHRLQLGDDHTPAEVGRVVGRVLHRSRSEQRLGRVERGLPAVAHQRIKLRLQRGGAPVKARLGIGDIRRLVFGVGQL